MPHPDPVTLADVNAARAAVASTIASTRMEQSASLSDLAEVQVFLKFEHLQNTGSFKLRGAANAVHNLDATARKNGVVAASTGNHGRGLAFAARQAGIRCVICMSRLVPQNKIDGIKAQGAEVRIVGSSQDDAQVEVDRLVSEEGMIMIPPFDHADVIAGQGSLGLDMLEQCPDATTLVVPLSGGGLIAGVAYAAKAKNPKLRVVGVSMARGAAMYQCLKAGKPIFVEEIQTLADALGGGIGLDNAYTYSMTRDLVDDVVLVDEVEIAQAIRHAYWQERQIVEGSGAVGIAAILAKKIALDGPTVILLSGGNIDMELHHRIISGEDVDVTQSTDTA